MATKWLTIFAPTGTADFTATLPASPVDGEYHRFKLVGPNANQVIVTLALSGSQRMDNGLYPSGYQLAGTGASVDMTWSSTENSWMLG